VVAPVLGEPIAERLIAFDGSLVDLEWDVEVGFEVSIS
jgi:hypothetical protein